MKRANSGVGRLTIQLLASMSLIGMGGTAVAQTATAGPTVNEGGLEDIVVTARKRAESLQAIPVAVTAYSPTQIQRMNISSIERIAAVTPNLQVGKATTGSGAQITLRGIGTPASALGIESSTAVIVDGVYFGNGRILNEGFFDLARIEVLKGPQALFFGKNATAGVISIATAEPGDSFEGMTRVGYEFNAQQPYIEQVISTPLSDTLGVRLAVRASKMFGDLARNHATPVTFSVTDSAGVEGAQTLTADPAKSGSPHERDFVGRLTLQWKPTDAITNTLKLSAADNQTNDGAWNNIVFSCANGYSTLQPAVPCKRKWSFYHNKMPQEIAANFPYASSNGDLLTKYRSYNVTNNFEYRMDDLTFTSVTNYQHQRNQWLTDSDYQQRTTQIYVGSMEKWRAFSEEARVQTDYDSPVNVMVGVLYQKSKVIADQNVYSGNARTSTASASNEYIAFSKYSTTDGETISPFGEISWKVVPQVEVSGGVRYTHETKKSFFNHPFVRTGQIYRMNTPINKNQTFTDWTPELTISYKPSDRINIYGGYKAGYKSGGFSNESSYTRFSQADELDFEPEKARGFEGGIKTTLMDNQLRLDLAAYSYKYTNLQVDFFEAQTFRFITTNAGSARTKGVELSTEFAPRAVPGLTLSGALNYNKARYINFIAPCVTGQTPLQGCVPATVGNNPFGGLYIQDLSGKPTAMAPKWTASAGISYEAPIGDGYSLAFTGNGRYSSAYNASPFNNPIATQGRYATFDASIFLRSEQGWDVGVIGKNLTNKFVVSGALDAPSTGSGTGTVGGKLGDQRGYANMPRAVQLQFTYRY